MFNNEFTKLKSTDTIFESSKVYYECKKKILMYSKELIIIIFIILGRKLYILSLKGCNGDEFSCLQDIKFIYDGFERCIKSSILFILILFLIQIKIAKPYYLIIVLIIFIEFMLKDRGNSFLNHGALNLYGFFLILFFGELLILIILIYIHLSKLKKLIFLIILIITIIFFSYKLKDKYHCKNWDKGLNNTYIDNNSTIYPCKIDIPKYKCFIDIIGPFIDFSYFIDCKKRSNKAKYILLENSNLRNKTNIKKIGYPITIMDKEEASTSLYESDLLKFVKNNLINMDNKKKLNKLSFRKQPEIFLDFSNDKLGEIKINLNYNKQLSKKCKLLEKKNENNVNSNNIIFLFLDNLSRVHFYRQYKKTSNFIKEFLKYEGYNKNQNNYHGFEFFKYHILGHCTLYNAIPMFSGVYFNKKNKMISILKNYKQNGYVSCNIQDICHKELMEVVPLKNYLYIEFDHEYVAPSCDPNIYNSGYDLFYSENGILKKCLFGKENFEYALEYGRQFWRAYKVNKRYLRIVNTYAHEYSGEKSKYTDNALYNFLKELYDSGQMENTTLFLAADHGYAGLFGIYKIMKAKDWMAEYPLPLLIIIESDKKNILYEKQFRDILKNQQNFVTPFDIYHTLSHNLYGNNYKSKLYYKAKETGESLFNYINPKNRNCYKYKIPKQNCRCN